MEIATSKTYEAFRLQPVIESLPRHQRVESLCCWRSDLLVGLHDGTVVQYSAPNHGHKWQVLKVHRSLERKAVLQMEAVRQTARPLLLTLTEDGVNLLTLPEMQLKFQPMGSRGASLFAWREDGQLLAVVVRRRVILYGLRANELVEAGERTAPDAVLSAAWARSGVLLLGMKRQYVLLNTATGGVTEVSPTGSAPHPLGQLCPGGQELLLARDSVTYYHGTADGHYSRRRHLQWSEPLLALATVGRHAVAITAGGVEVRSLRRMAEGHVVQRVALAGPPRPVTPAVSEDGSVYLAAASAAATAAATTSPTAAATATAAVGSTEAVAIYRLQPVPLEEQAHTLAELGEYGEALALAALVEDEEAGADGKGNDRTSHAGSEVSAGDVAAETAFVSATGGGGGKGGGSGSGSSRRAALEEQLRLAYGHYLFQAGEYDEGMGQLALCKSTTALLLLRLFPSLVAPKFKHLLPTAAAGHPLPDMTEPTGEAYITAVSQLLPYILSHRNRAITILIDTETEAPGAPQHAVATQPGCVGNGHGATTSADVTTTGGPSSTSSPDDTLRQRMRAPDPCAHGTQAQVSASTSLPPSASASTPTSTTGSAANEQGGHEASCVAAGEAATEPVTPPLRELLSVLDTAIVRMMVVLPDTGALLRFVQQSNYVDLQEGEQALSESGMYAELAALYKANCCHEQGLELLRKLSQEPSALPRPARGAAADLLGLPGVWAAVRYIVTLSAEQAPAITRHAGWILAADAEAGLSALLHMRPPLHPSLALSILNQHSRHYCGLYLETALQIGVALPQDYHNELLLIYLRDILTKEPLSPSLASANHSGDELKELLLLHRPDPGQSPVLFPEDLAHALLNSSSQTHGAAGGATWRRRFASAPPSSGGTPARGLSPVGSQGSLLRGAKAQPRRRWRSDRVESIAPVGSCPERSAHVGTRTEDEDEDEEADEEGEAGTTGGKGEKGDADSSQGSATASEAMSAGGSRVSTPTHRSRTASAPSRPRRLRSPVRPTETDAAAAPATRRPSVASQPPSRPQEPSGKTPVPDASPDQADASLPLAGASPFQGSDNSNQAAAAAARPSLYQRLRDLVYTSPYIDPGYVLDKLPMGELLEIRALMLERLGAHREALRLYVHALQDLAGAEAYCDRVYSAAVTAAASAGGAAAPAPALTQYNNYGLLGGLLMAGTDRPGDIYLELVQALYDGPESCPSAAAVAGGALSSEAERCGVRRLDSATWQALAALLSRKRERLDPVRVLALLPDDAAVTDVVSWLERSLSFNIEARRNLAVARQLRRSQNLSALEEAVRVRQRRVVVTSERACSICHKRIGGAVFVSYPGGLLAHYLCHKRHADGGGGSVSGAGGGGEVGFGDGGGSAIFDGYGGAMSSMGLQQGLVWSVGDGETAAWV